VPSQEIGLIVRLGYDTGQISGFLEMQVFLERFGTPVAVDKTNQYGYHFTNVRSGLIVGMVRRIRFILDPSADNINSSLSVLSSAASQPDHWPTDSDDELAFLLGA